MHAAPGVYALLIGSGVSRAASVPTGWEVTQALIRRIAVAAGVEEPADPVAWYLERFSDEPRYPDVVAKVAPAQAERQLMLRGFFEPPQDEDGDPDAGRPTKAHRAIARLVSSGHVRVIVTTNFDRLLEGALADAGIQPAVIASADGASGAVPLVHSRCTVIKVHGDYLDTRIRNTDEELARYEPAMDRLLAQVFDEYGLIVSGWSGDFDLALRDAIVHAPGRRYTTWWVTRSGRLGQGATDLLAARAGRVVIGGDADRFFDELTERVEALASARTVDDLSVDIVRARAKRYVADPIQRVRYADLLRDTTARVTERRLAVVGGIDVPLTTTDGIAAIDGLEALTWPVVTALTVGVRWGGSEHIDEVERAIRSLAHVEQRIGHLVNLDLLWYPALLAWYAVGVTAVVADRPEAAARILAARSGISSAQGWLAEALVLEHPVPDHLAEAIRDRDTGSPRQMRQTPTSDHLHQVLADLLAEHSTGHDDYSWAFSRWEFVAGLHVFAASDLARRGSGAKAWTLVGRHRSKDWGRVTSWWQGELESDERAARWIHPAAPIHDVPGLRTVTDQVNEVLRGPDFAGWP